VNYSVLAPVNHRRAKKIMKDYFEAGRLFAKNLIQSVIFLAVTINRKRIITTLRSIRNPEKKSSLFSEALSEGLQDLFREMGYKGKNKDRV
jgi:hypothetical protein